jgi:hypothetical protein
MSVVAVSFSKIKKRRHIVYEDSITETALKLRARMATVLPTRVNGMWPLDTSNPWNLHRSFSPTNGGDLVQVESLLPSFMVCASETRQLRRVNEE